MDWTPKNSLRAGLIAGLAIATAAPSLVSAQGYDNRYNNYHDYDGYCYERQKDAKADGAVIGAIAGGAIGGTVADTHNKGLGTVLGALVGAAIGSNAASSKSSCYGGRYYAYQGAYYDPPAPPRGYVTVFFHERPGRHHFREVYYDRTNRAPPRADRGWRDDRGGWHNGRAPRNGWKDDHGYWHGRQH